ncbi:hypothetical protein OIU78_020491 [Salix suchowensis]|nr:hypothetical protein OIU78_020491 [Salix suchowensis]
MDSFSGATDSVNGELEAASSSTNEGLTGDKTGSPLAKGKKRKGKKKRVADSPSQASDHSAIVVNLVEAPKPAQSPFKFMNQWAEHEDFMQIVHRVWDQPITGNAMFQFTSKLLKLK